MSLKIISWNIYYEIYKNDWKKEKKEIKKFIDKEDPDILLTQESIPDNLSNKYNTLSYKLYKPKQGGLKDYVSEIGILYNKNKLRQDGPIYRTDYTNNVPGIKCNKEQCEYKGKDSPRPFLATRLISNNQSYLFINLWAEHYYKTNYNVFQDIISNIIKELYKDGDRIIVIGDFNEFYNKEKVNILKLNEFDLKYINIGKTCCGNINKNSIRWNNKIKYSTDFLYDSFEGKNINTSFKEIKISDHYPIIVEIKEGPYDNSVIKNMVGGTDPPGTSAKSSSTSGPSAKSSSTSGTSAKSSSTSGTSAKSSSTSGTSAKSSSTSGTSAKKNINDDSNIDKLESEIKSKKKNENKIKDIGKLIDLLKKKKEDADKEIKQKIQDISNKKNSLRNRTLDNYNRQQIINDIKKLEFDIKNLRSKLKKYQEKELKYKNEKIDLELSLSKKLKILSWDIKYKEPGNIIPELKRTYEEYNLVTSIYLIQNILQKSFNNIKKELPYLYYYYKFNTLIISNKNFNNELFFSFGNKICIDKKTKYYKKNFKISRLPERGFHEFNLERRIFGSIIGIRLYLKDSNKKFNILNVNLTNLGKRIKGDDNNLKKEEKDKNKYYKELNDVINTKQIKFIIDNILKNVDEPYVVAGNFNIKNNILNLSKDADDGLQIKDEYDSPTKFIYKGDNLTNFEVTKEQDAFFESNVYQIEINDYQYSFGQNKEGVKKIKLNLNDKFSKKKILEKLKITNENLTNKPTNSDKEKPTEKEEEEKSRYEKIKGIPENKRTNKDKCFVKEMKYKENIKMVEEKKKKGESLTKDELKNYNIAKDEAKRLEKNREELESLKLDNKNLSNIEKKRLKKLENKNSLTPSEKKELDKLVEKNKILTKIRKGEKLTDDEKDYVLKKYGDILTRLYYHGRIRSADNIDLSKFKLYLSNYDSNYIKSFHKAIMKNVGLTIKKIDRDSKIIDTLTDDELKELKKNVTRMSKFDNADSKYKKMLRSIDEESKKRSEKKKEKNNSKPSYGGNIDLFDFESQEIGSFKNVNLLSTVMKSSNISDSNIYNKTIPYLKDYPNFYMTVFVNDDITKSNDFNFNKNISSKTRNLLDAKVSTLFDKKKINSQIFTPINNNYDDDFFKILEDKQQTFNSTGDIAGSVFITDDNKVDKVKLNLYLIKEIDWDNISKTDKKYKKNAEYLAFKYFSAIIENFLKQDNNRILFLNILNDNNVYHDSIKYIYNGLVHAFQYYYTSLKDKLDNNEIRILLDISKDKYKEIKYNTKINDIIYFVDKDIRFKNINDIDGKIINKNYYQLNTVITQNEYDDNKYYIYQKDSKNNWIDNKNPKDDINNVRCLLYCKNNKSISSTSLSILTSVKDTVKQLLEKTTFYTNLKPRPSLDGDTPKEIIEKLYINNRNNIDKVLYIDNLHKNYIFKDEYKKVSSTLTKNIIFEDAVFYNYFNGSLPNDVSINHLVIGEEKKKTTTGGAPTPNIDVLNDIFSVVNEDNIKNMLKNLKFSKERFNYAKIYNKKITKIIDSIEKNTNNNIINSGILNNLFKTLKEGSPLFNNIFDTNIKRIEQILINKIKTTSSVGDLFYDNIVNILIKEIEELIRTSKEDKIKNIDLSKISEKELELIALGIIKSANKNLSNITKNIYRYSQSRKLKKNKKKKEC